eukprot:scpid111926/ scgid29731/ 
MMAHCSQHQQMYHLIVKETAQTCMDLCNTCIQVDKQKLSVAMISLVVAKHFTFNSYSLGISHRPWTRMGGYVLEWQHNFREIIHNTHFTEQSYTSTVTCSTRTSSLHKPA